MKTSRALTVFRAICIALVLLTASIAAPILCRPFYYAHIGPLGLVAETGLTEAEIRTAYSEMLDFCLGGEEFSTGVLPFSPAGESHFRDVRALFLLDLWVLGGSVLGLVLLFLLSRLFRRPARLLKRGAPFWAGAGLGSLFLLLGGLAAIDFDRTFVIFHAIFFPGKDNWLFDPNTDGIIRILPDVFFRNCGILILTLLLLGCLALILWDLLRGRKIEK